MEEPARGRWGNGGLSAQSAVRGGNPHTGGTDPVRGKGNPNPERYRTVKYRAGAAQDNGKQEAHVWRTATHGLSPYNHAKKEVVHGKKNTACVTACGSDRP